jgi:hypothetical protein
MNSFETLSEAITYLRQQGYVEDFNLKQNCIECRNGQYKIFAQDFKVEEFFRFEDNTDPGDQSIPYAISSEKYGLKGILVNGYGIYSESLTNEMSEKLSFRKNQ